MKFGQRKKKLETVQIYFCNHCRKRFTPLVTRGKTFPVFVILKSLILFSRFMSPAEISEKIKKDFGLSVSPQTIENWVGEYRERLPFLRMREFLEKKILAGETKLSEIVHESRLFHGQIYDFGYHRGKAKLLMDEDYKNFKLSPAADFLELVIAECPHRIFRDSRTRSSEFRNIFNLDEVRVSRKDSRASEAARFVTQAVANNKERHARLQEFMLSCDSVTIAREVPVLLDRDDILHYRNVLNFEVPLILEKEEDVLTGHIDLLQMRNGMIHILDYKPSARKEKPIDQLTLYALALSRQTTLRLYNFKCAWFDEDDYFEFFPLHAVWKKKSGGRKKTAR